MTSRLLFKSSMAMRSTTNFITASSRQMALPAQRTFASSPAMLKHKESSGADEHLDPDKHKQDLLSKHKEGKGHWKPELASDSEEAVKADRASTAAGGGAATAEDVRAMQERTKRTAEETSKSGTSMHDGL
ncbi:hypothetical protein F5X99DRAFT_411052 [Biscogniauxia marginata]|nr:hypothetical protein F5X99DRAFT_411052 [Biscogniauxia marginata]